MKIGVIVNTYNRPAALRLVLLGLAVQTRTPDEVIIADDGSSGDTRDLIGALAGRFNNTPYIHVWHEDMGFRRSQILNLAIARSTADLLVFLDGDCVPQRDFVAQHGALYQDNVILAGQRVLLSKRFTQILESSEDIHRIPARYSLQWVLGRFRGDVNRLAPFLRLPDGRWRTRDPSSYHLVRGCNFSVARRSLLCVGGLEESIEGWGFEDSELAVRLINNGLKVKSMRFSSPVLHLWHPEADRSSAERNRALLDQAIAEHKVSSVRGLKGAQA
jgi:glycosyltransferase involved in cell wall biosynthesis